MCDIFPEVENCCFAISLRIAMLLISVLAIVSIFFIYRYKYRSIYSAYSRVGRVIQMPRKKPHNTSYTMPERQETECLKTRLLWFLRFP